jgi:hypothetical protein
VLRCKGQKRGGKRPLRKHEFDSDTVRRHLLNTSFDENSLDFEMSSRFRKCAVAPRRCISRSPKRHREDLEAEDLEDLEKT